MNIGPLVITSVQYLFHDRKTCAVQAVSRWPLNREGLLPFHVEFMVDTVALECPLKWKAKHGSYSNIMSDRKYDKTGNVRVNVTTKRVGEIIVAVEKQEVIHILSVYFYP
jgi:hypothetical protein